MKTSGNI